MLLHSCRSLVGCVGQVLAESVSTDCRTGTSEVAAFKTFTVIPGRSEMWPEVRVAGTAKMDV
jgi:hypothetical protein